MSFPVHTTATAPQAAQSLLQGVQQKFGFVPNLLGTMASEPALLEAYLTLNSIFEKSSLNPTERQLVLIAVSQANGCQYCLAAHSALAMMAKVDGPLIVAAREGRPTGDHKLDALLSFTREVTSSRGYPSARTRKANCCRQATPTHQFLLSCWPWESKPCRTTQTTSQKPRSTPLFSPKDNAVMQR